MFVTPVTLPPGRARLAISPDPTGSDTAKNTIGMDEVARFAASAAGVAQTRIRSTRLCANSFAKTGNASKLLSAHLEGEVAPFDVATLAQTAAHGRQQLGRWCA